MLTVKIVSSVIFAAMALSCFAAAAVNAHQLRRRRPDLRVGSIRSFLSFVASCGIAFSVAAIGVWFSPAFLLAAIIPIVATQIAIKVLVPRASRISSDPGD